ncbi:MAG TPA: GAF domain-containing sensor histidine kinase [Kofleriaceae bacterium]|nr:GAF domain-containing sensor histidine kinase [Kofleriaceae bacterium]
MADERSAIEHLTALMSEVARASSLEEVYERALDCLRRALGVERSSLLLFDQGGVMRFVAWRGLSDEYRRAVDGHSPWRPDQREARPVLVPDVERDEELNELRDLFRREGIAALAFVPLAYGDRLLGKFMLYHGERHQFSAEEVAVASAIAGHVAYAIERMRIALRADAAAARLRVLAEATAALAESLDDDAALQRLAEIAVANLADYAVTYSLGPDRVIRRVGVSHRDPGRAAEVEELLRLQAPTIADPVGAGMVIRTGQSILASHVTPAMLELAARGSADYRDALLRLSPQSSILVPLRARDQTIGAIALAATDASGRVYGEDDLLLVEELARRAALLVHNSRLYRLAQEAVRGRDDVIAVVSHDLRNPLQAILSSCALLERSGLGELDARHTVAIRRSAARMERLIQDLLDIARIEAGGLALKLEPVDPVALLGEARDLHQPLAEERAVTLAVSVTPPLSPVRADRRRLLQAVSNLIDNALKFVPSGGRVELRAEDDGGKVRISVSDTGPGIPAEQLPHLFDRFWQGHRDSGHGAGLGLAIVKGIADAHGAALHVAAGEQAGSTFAITLQR